MASAKKSISERLNIAQVAIQNSLNDPAILNAVSPFGYDTAKLTEGNTLLEAARAAVGSKTGGKGSQKISTAQLKQAEKTAQTAYQALAQVARAVFAQDKAKLSVLGLSGAMPRSTAGFLNKAYTLFDNASANADIKTTLAKYSYTQTKLTAERAKIAAYDTANQAQESAKGSAQQSSRSQDAALKALDQWVAQYLKIAKIALAQDRDALEKIGVLARNSKTAAQRAAPMQAAASRAAKTT